MGAKGWSPLAIGQAAANATRGLGGSVEEAAKAAGLAAAEAAKKNGEDGQAVADAGSEAASATRQAMGGGGPLSDKTWSEYKGDGEDKTMLQKLQDFPTKTVLWIVAAVAVLGGFALA